jgi:alpha-1,3-rhamnosyltransferase
MSPPSPPLISVLIPLFNRATYIAKTLDSLLNDRYPNTEILLLDDGSTDNSLAVVQQWAIKHPSVKIQIKSRPNKGLAQSIHELIGWSKAKYVVFMDSDDLLLPDGLIKRYEFMKNNPAVRLAFGDCILIDDDGTKIAESALQHFKVDVKSLAEGENIRKYAILNGFTTGSTQIVDKRLFEEIEGLTRFKYSQDWLLTVQAASVNRLAFCNEKVSAYRVHLKGSSSNLSSSWHQTKVLKENLCFISRMLFTFPGFKYKIYILRQIVYSCIHYPYLCTKFYLSDVVKTTQNPLLRSWFKILLDSIIAFKSIFRKVTRKSFLKAD